MAYKRLVRQEGAQGNVVDDVSVKHATITDTISGLSTAQLALKTEVPTEFVRRIKIGNTTLTPDTNKDVTLPSYVDLKTLTMKKSPTDTQPVTFDGSVPVTIDFSQYVIAQANNILQLQKGGVNSVSYNGSSGSTQTFNIENLTVTRGTSTTDIYNGAAKTIAIKTFNLKNAAGTDITGGKYDTVDDVTLRFPTLRIIANGGNYDLDPSPTNTTGSNTLRSINLGNLGGLTVTTSIGATGNTPSWGTISADCSPYKLLIFQLIDDINGAITSVTIPPIDVSIGSNVYIIYVNSSGSAGRVIITPNKSAATSGSTTFSITSNGAMPSEAAVQLKGVY